MLFQDHKILTFEYTHRFLDNTNAKGVLTYYWLHVFPYNYYLKSSVLVPCVIYNDACLIKMIFKRRSLRINLICVMAITALQKEDKN